MGTEWSSASPELTFREKANKLLNRTDSYLYFRWWIGALRQPSATLKNPAAYGG